MVGIGEEPKYLIRLFALNFDKYYEICEGLEMPVDSKFIANVNICL